MQVTMYYTCRVNKYKYSLLSKFDKPLISSCKPKARDIKHSMPSPVPACMVCWNSGCATCIYMRTILACTLLLCFALGFWLPPDSIRERSCIHRFRLSFLRGPWSIFLVVALVLDIIFILCFVCRLTIIDIIDIRSLAQVRKFDRSQDNLNMNYVHAFADRAHLQILQVQPSTHRCVSTSAWRFSSSETTQTHMRI